MAQPLETKLTYRPSRKLQVFFTGGAARVSRDGKLLVCACGDEAKVRIDGVAGHQYRRANAVVEGCEQEHACMGVLGGVPGVAAATAAREQWQRQDVAAMVCKHSIMACSGLLRVLRLVSSISDGFEARSIGKHRAVTYLQDCTR